MMKLKRRRNKEYHYLIINRNRLNMWQLSKLDSSAFGNWRCFIVVSEGLDNHLIHC